jgi:glycerol-1-phosphate dehydrogenase [NAD(P)+]
MNTLERTLSECKAIVCDLDGTLYMDGKPFDYSRAFLDKVLQSGKKLFYFTNNSSKSRSTYLKRLQEIGFPAKDEYLITSTDCTVSYLLNHQLNPDIYLVGNQDLIHDFQNYGFNPLSSSDALNSSKVKAVVLGFDTELTYEKIDTCYQLILRDVPYVATHADFLCPVSKGTFKPDVGSFIAMFETATQGRVPQVMGKPHKQAVQAIAEKAQCPPHQIAFIGDRLYTDIRMAEQFEMVGILVLSGETTRTMLKSSQDQPTFTIENVSHLTELL